MKIMFTTEEVRAVNELLISLGEEPKGITYGEVKTYKSCIVKYSAEGIEVEMLTDCVKDAISLGGKYLGILKQVAGLIKISGVTRMAEEFTAKWGSKEAVDKVAGKMFN